MLSHRRARGGLLYLFAIKFCRYVLLARIQSWWTRAEGVRDGDLSLGDRVILSC
jgi:hypothetical protein